jgi:surfeit locus 1 family protein
MVTDRWRRWVVLAAALCCAGIAFRLGVWQLDRAAQKQAMLAALNVRSAMPAIDAPTLARTPEQAAGQHYRRVRLQGRWLPRSTVFLDNRQMSGRPGFFVVTPLQLPGEEDAVLVQRGWVPRDQLERTRLPAVPTAAGMVEVAGIIAPPPSRLFEFSAQASGPIRQNLGVAGFSRETAVPLLPLSVLQSDSPATAGDGLLRQWSPPAIDVHTHYGYAFQWFALGALMTGLYVWFQLVRPRLRNRLGHRT